MGVLEVDILYLNFILIKQEITPHIRTFKVTGVMNAENKHYMTSHIRKFQL
jgi:hypothetical protein